MSAKIEKTENNNEVKLEITIEAEKFDAAIKTVYIKNAKYLVTDSFHGTAFSINFNKQFAVIYPEHFSTRMDNILQLTGLKEQRYRDSDSIEKWDSVISYEEVNSILTERRNKVEDTFKSYIESLR